MNEFYPPTYKSSNTVCQNRTVEAKWFDSCTGALEPCIQNLYSARKLQMVRTILNKKREKKVESPHGGLRPVVCSSNR